MQTTTPQIQPGRLLTIKDVQLALCCGKAKAWNLVKAGHLTRVRFSARMTRFKSDELIELIEKGVLQ
ncbi:hypothetical protein SAMN02745119_02008 [Trichlorobacter thiogenes]|uniref:Helix-turn-helix domain-containing protein n=1 Tax=Trichlorobacter thiogenes TaxID=115783 RepID=A0A1T4PKG1_9BACT|nr:helix-turn-helix domain-containing protein [Trichlorobacter thiogenes]SJZ92053.1 hypothetical protein SAMN02745119_02008 [Trichlorobacter thiogenes]